MTDGEYKWKALSLQERYAAAPWILGRNFLSPYGMFEIVDLANIRYLWSIATDLRSGKELRIMGKYVYLYR